MVANSFKFLAIINNAAMNILISIFLFMIYIKYNIYTYYTLYTHIHSCPVFVIKVAKKLLEIMHEVGDQFGKSVHSTHMY